MITISPDGIIGILGGGQLGRMTALAASNLGYRTHIYCPEDKSPAAEVSTYVTVAPYNDIEQLKIFASNVDVISFEFENIPDKTIRILEDIVNVRPSHKSLHIAQNRLREKSFFGEIGVPTTNFSAVTSIETLKSAYKKLGNDKALLKTCELGYDGKGQIVIHNENELEQAWQDINNLDCILEDFIGFQKEISIIIARDVNENCVIYPPAENIHINGILDTSIVPAIISDKTKYDAEDIAHKIAVGLQHIGILAVEFFVQEDGSLIVNEIAPRPHNSGHWTQDGCVTSQFEQFVRAICGLPLGSSERLANVTMKNLLGTDINEWENILKNPNAKLHLYGKKEARDGRKMGHVNYINTT